MSALMREEFEEAFKKEFGFGRLTASAIPDARQVMGAAWWAWQASRECQVIELPIIQECCSDGGESSKWMAPEDVIESIHAAGVKTK